MTEQEINIKLVDDVTRIIVVGSMIQNAGHKNWKQISKEVLEGLNAGDEQKYIDTINGILEDYAGATDIEGVLDKHYLTNTRSLLKYRIEAREAEESHILEPIQYVDTAVMTKDDYSTLKNLLIVSHTVSIGYHMLELYNTIEELTKKIAKEVGVAVSIMINKNIDAELFREKVPYLGHRIWACTPLLPAILVSLDTPVLD